MMIPEDLALPEARQQQSKKALKPRMISWCIAKVDVAVLEV
jgi:hypothetical protein